MLPFLILASSSIVTILSIETGIYYARKRLKLDQLARARTWQGTEVYQAFKPSYAVVFDEIVATLNKTESEGLSSDVYKLSLRLLGGVLPLLSTVAGSEEGQVILAIGASISSLILLVFGSVATSDANRSIVHGLKKNILNFFAESSGFDGNISEATRFKILVRSVNSILDSNAIGAVADAGTKTKEPIAIEAPVIPRRAFTVDELLANSGPLPIVAEKPKDSINDMETLSGQALIDQSPFPKISQ